MIDMPTILAVICLVLAMAGFIYAWHLSRPCIEDRLADALDEIWETTLPEPQPVLWSPKDRTQAYGYPSASGHQFAPEEAESGRERLLSRVRMWQNPITSEEPRTYATQLFDGWADVLTLGGERVARVPIEEPVIETLDIAKATISKVGPPSETIRPRPRATSMTDMAMDRYLAKYYPQGLEHYSDDQCADSDLYW